MAASNMGSFITGLLVVVVVVGLVYMVDPTFFGLMGYSMEGFAPGDPPQVAMNPRSQLYAGQVGGDNESVIGQGPMKINAAQQKAIQEANIAAANATQGVMVNSTRGSSRGFNYMSQEQQPMIASGKNNTAANIAAAAQQTATTTLIPRAMPRPIPKGGDFQDINHKEAFENMASVSSNADFGTAEAPAGCYPRDQLTPSELLPKDNNSVWAEQNPMGPGSLKGKNFLSAGALLGVNTVGQSLRNANLQLRSEPPNPQMPVSIFNQSTIQPDVNRRPLEIN